MSKIIILIFVAAECWDNFYFKDEYFEIIQSGEIEYTFEVDEATYNKYNIGQSYP